MTSLRKHRLLVAGLAAVVVIATACGSSSKSGSATTSSGSAATSTTAGTAGSTPATNAAATSQSGPAPQPLPQLTTVTISAGPTPTVGFSAVLLANYFGEFAKENLKVNLTFQTVPNALVLLESNRVQMAAIGLSAGFFNAIHAGANAQLVFPSSQPGATSLTGIYARTGILSPDGTFDACKLKTGHWTVSIGPSANVGILPLSELVAKCPNTTLSQVTSHITFSPLTGPDLVLGLENGSVDLALLYDPLPETPGLSQHAKLVQPTPADAVLAGYVAGSIVKNKPAVLNAILRAMLRTQNTYLQGDYLKNPTVVAALAKVLSVPSKVIEATPASVFPSQLSTNGIVELQNQYIQLGGVLTFNTPIPPEQFTNTAPLAQVNSGQ